MASPWGGLRTDPDRWDLQLFERGLDALPLLRGGPGAPRRGLQGVAHLRVVVDRAAVEVDRRALDAALHIFLLHQDATKVRV